MTLNTDLSWSTRPSSYAFNQRRTLRSLFGALLLVITFAISISGQQTNTTNSHGKTPSGMAPGSAAAAYPLTGFENINLFNGNLSFRLPLMSVGGRGSVASEITIGFNTKGWRVNHFHKVMPDGNEIDNYSPTQTCTGPGPTYGPGTMSGKRSGIFTSNSLSCGTRYSKTLSRLNFVMPDGTEYEFRDQLAGGEPKSVAGFACNSGFNRGTVFVTADGSAATFISDTDIVDNGTLTGGCGGGFSVSGFMLLRDGTRYRIDNGLVTWIRDRNGNKISYTYDAIGRVITITDALNRQISINYDVSDVAPYGLCDQIIFKGAGGAQRIIRISKTAMANALRPNSGFSIQTHQQLFPELNNSSPTTTYNPTVITKVWLPNSDGTGQHHQFYQFFYNSYGELARVELPTGGAFEYDMSPGSGVIVACQFCDGPEINRRLRERRVYSDGSSGSTFESKTTYEVTSDSAPLDPFPWSSTITTETVNQSGGVVARSRHFFEGSAFVSLFKSYGADVYSVWNDGREKKTEILDTSGQLATATVLRRTETSMEQRTTIPWWNSYCSGTTNCGAEPSMDPRVTEIKTTIEPSGANLVTKQVFDYDDFVPFNNQNNLKEYAFNTGAPGALIRETQTTYVTDPTYTGTNVHLRSLVTQVSVFEGITERSRTAFEYDIYTATSNHAALTDRPNISGFDSAFGTQYTTRGNPTASTRYLLVNNQVIGSFSTFSQYDIAGNSVKAIDGRGYATTSEFSDRFGGPDADARANSSPTELSAPGKFSYGYPTLVTNALGHTTYTQFDYYLGKPVDSEDANGVVASAFYNDSLDRPTQLIRGNNLSGPPKTQTTIAYDDVNRQITSTSDHNTFNDTSPLKTQTVNDQMGRNIETRRYESLGGFITVKIQYDALGRPHRVSNPYRSGENVLWTTNVFDALGRVTSVTTPDSAVATTSYNGNTVTTTDQNGKQRQTVTDALGRLTSLYEAPNDPSYNYLTTYGYDVLDNLTTVTQGVQTRSFVYDSLKRLSSASIPESGTTNYQYDGNDNVIVKSDVRGVVSTYAYDALNRNTSVTYTNDPAGTPTVSRYFDGFRDEVNNNIPYSVGKLWQTETSGAKGARTTINSFDPLGNPLSLSQQFKNGTWSAPYTVLRMYNLAGRVKSQTYPSGREVTYNYDFAGRVYSFAGNLGGNSRTYSTSISYSPLGGITQEQFGTDTALYRKNFYNSRGQQAEIRVGTFHATDNTWWNRGAIINHFSMNCWGACGGSNSSTPMVDNNGNLKKQDVYIPGNDQISTYTQWWQGYDYDPVNRLQRVHEYASAGDSQQEYVYDRYGNRTIHQTNTFGTGINKKDFTVNTSNNRLGVPTGQSGAMIYDDAGNLTTDTYSGFAVTRVFDAENRVLSETQAGGLVGGSYAYSADGQRVRRNAGGVETWHVMGMDAELLAEYPMDGAASSPKKEYGYRNNELLVTADVGAKVNVALSSNGGFATTSSSFSLSYQGNGAINGDRKGQNWGAGGGWHDATGGSFPDWIQVDFNGSRTIDEIDVFTVQDNFSSPVEPTEAMTFSLYGLTSYDVQYWNGSAWTTVPGGSITGNNKVWRRITFAPISTSKIRVSTNASIDGYSRITEVEAWGNPTTEYRASTGFSGVQGTQNWFYMDSAGGYMNYVPANNWWFGPEQYNLLWSTGGHPGNSWDAVRQWRSPAAGNIRITGSASDGDPGGGDGVIVTIKKNAQVLWQQTIANGNTSGVSYDISTSVVAQDQISFVINRAGSSSWDSTNFDPTITLTIGGAPTSQLNWLVTDQVGTPRMVIDSTGSLSGVKRHDYLPFGEELSSNQGLRSPSLGYGSSDGVRQKFTSKERDVETGLDYFGARYNSSIQGRFISVDPLLSSGRPDNAQTWNRYSYVLNNPLCFVDPSGLFTFAPGVSAADRILLMEAWDALVGALADLEVGSKAYQAVERALKALGEPGEANGVVLTVGATSDPRALAQTDVNQIDKGTITITFNADKLSKDSVTGRAANLAHEGVHVDDANKLYAASNKSKVTFLRRWSAMTYRKEFDARWGDIGPFQALGYKPYSVGLYTQPTKPGKAQNVPERLYLWNPAWSNLDIKEIENKQAAVIKTILEAPTTTNFGYGLKEPKNFKP